jgi:hypothetical protein
LKIFSYFFCLVGVFLRQALTMLFIMASNSWPHKCWDYKHVPPHPDLKIILLDKFLKHMTLYKIDQ